MRELAEALRDTLGWMQRNKIGSGHQPPVVEALARYDKLMGGRR